VITAGPPFLPSSQSVRVRNTIVEAFPPILTDFEAVGGHFVGADNHCSGSDNDCRCAPPTPFLWLFLFALLSCCFHKPVPEGLECLTHHC